MGVASGCGEQEVYIIYRFHHTTYRSLLLLYIFVPFCSSIPTFCSFFNVLRSCSPVLFVIKMYVLNNFFTQYKHTYGQIRASHGSHMKAAHNVLYMKKHTQTFASYPAERGVDLEAEGVRYNYRDESRATYIMVPDSFKGRRSLTRGRSQCVLVKIWRSTWKMYLVWRLNVVVR